MRAVTREIAKVLLEYSRTEPLGEVQLLVLERHPEIANVSAERWEAASMHDKLSLGMAVIMAANEIRAGTQQRQQQQGAA